MKKKIISSLVLSGLILGGVCIPTSAKNFDFETTFNSGCIDSDLQHSKEKQQHLLNLVSKAAEFSEKSYELAGEYKGLYFGNVNGVPAGFTTYTEIDGEKYIVVAIHGTANLDDAVTDAKALRTKCDFLNNLYVHNGFYQHLSA